MNTRDKYLQLHYKIHRWLTGSEYLRSVFGAKKYQFHLYSKFITLFLYSVIVFSCCCCCYFWCNQLKMLMTGWIILFYDFFLVFPFIFSWQFLYCIFFCFVIKNATFVCLILLIYKKNLTIVRKAVESSHDPVLVLQYINILFLYSLQLANFFVLIWWLMN